MPKEIKEKIIKGWARDFSWGKKSDEIQFTDNMRTAASWFQMGYDLFWAELKIIKKLGSKSKLKEFGK